MTSSSCLYCSYYPVKFWWHSAHNPFNSCVVVPEQIGSETWTNWWEFTVACVALLPGGQSEQRVQVAVSGQRETARLFSVGCHGDQPLHRRGKRGVPLWRESVDGSGGHGKASQTRLSKDGVLCGSNRSSTDETELERSKDTPPRRL